MRTNQRMITKAGIAALLVCVVLSGCSSSHNASSPTTTVSSSTAATVPPTGQAKEAALTAYRDMWRDFTAAGHTSDWQSAALGRHATGTALSTMSRGLYADHYNGLVTKGEPMVNPQVSSAEPTDDPSRVIIADCGDSSKWLKYRADTDEPADDGPAGRRRITAVVDRQANGSWLVSDFGVQAVGTC